MENIQTGIATDWSSIVQKIEEETDKAVEIRITSCSVIRLNSNNAKHMTLIEFISQL